ncbi:MAG: DUF5915 domain-containing protein [Kiritimatiellia bacterium]|nr:DUF5915 domain-containing protein [Kiritimatiellia bacterium]
MVRPLAELVADELNIKEVRFGSDETALAELSAKANYKTLGPRLGRTIKKAVEAIAAFGTTELAQLLDNQDVVITLDDAPVSLTPADVLIQRTPKEGLAVASSGDLLVALETTLTPALIEEGHARELINRIQNQRKAQDLDVADRITLTITADAELVAAITTHRDTITAETLAVELTTAEGTGDIEINGHLCTIDIERA